MTRPLYNSPRARSIARQLGELNAAAPDDRADLRAIRRRLDVMLGDGTQADRERQALDALDEHARRLNQARRFFHGAGPLPCVDVMLNKGAESLYPLKRGERWYLHSIKSEGERGVYVSPSPDRASGGWTFIELLDVVDLVPYVGAPTPPPEVPVRNRRRGAYKPR